MQEPAYVKEAKDKLQEAIITVQQLSKEFNDAQLKWQSECLHPSKQMISTSEKNIQKCNICGKTL